MVHRVGGPQIDVEFHPLLGDGAAERVAEGDVDVVVAEVDRRHGSIPGHHPEYRRGPPAAGAGAPSLGLCLRHSFVRQKPGHSVVHSAAGQPAEFDDPGPGSPGRMD